MPRSASVDRQAGTLVGVGALGVGGVAVDLDVERAGVAAFGPESLGLPVAGGVVDVVAGEPLLAGGGDHGVGLLVVLPDLESGNLGAAENRSAGGVAEHQSDALGSLGGGVVLDGDGERLLGLPGSERQGAPYPGVVGDVGHGTEVVALQGACGLVVHTDRGVRVAVAGDRDGGCRVVLVDREPLAGELQRRAGGVVQRPHHRV